MELVDTRREDQRRARFGFWWKVLVAGGAVSDDGRLRYRAGLGTWWCSTTSATSNTTLPCMYWTVQVQVHVLVVLRTGTILPCMYYIVLRTGTSTGIFHCRSHRFLFGGSTRVSSRNGSAPWRIEQPAIGVNAVVVNMYRARRWNFTSLSSFFNSDTGFCGLSLEWQLTTITCLWFLLNRI
jgi:hypothetical protein